MTLLTLNYTVGVTWLVDIFISGLLTDNGMFTLAEMLKQI